MFYPNPDNAQAPARALGAFQPPKPRNLRQNRLLWACLNDVSARIEWHGQWLTPPEWKDMFTAALRRDKVVPGINGGFVVFGERTSTMTTEQMAELIDFIHAFAAEHGVTLWSWEMQP